MYEPGDEGKSTPAWPIDSSDLHLDKLNTLGLLAAGMAHDFNNLLTVINGYAEMALKHYPNGPLRKPLEEISRAGNLSKELTRQILQFSRETSIESVQIRLNSLVWDLEGILRILCGQRVQLSLDLNAQPDLIRAGTGRMQQVVVNLAINAAEAMPNGGRLSIATTRVTVDDAMARLYSGLTPGPHVQLTVSDTGLGMSPEVKERLFRPFFTTKGSNGGTGLGLSAAYMVVRENGGAISVESEPGFGSTFRLLLRAE